MIAIQSERFAVTVFEIASFDRLALQLVGIERLDVSAMVLVKVGKLVVEQDGWLHVGWYLELDDALELFGDVCDGGVVCVVKESIPWGCWV